MEKSFLDLCMKAPRPTNVTDNYKKCYAWNNGVVSFLTEDGEYYSTPYCHDAKEYLESLGYEEKIFTVTYEYSWPYTDEETGKTIYFAGPAPTDGEEAKKWYELCEAAREKYYSKKL